MCFLWMLTTSDSIVPVHFWVKSKPLFFWEIRFQWWVHCQLKLNYSLHLNYCCVLVHFSIFISFLLYWNVDLKVVKCPPFYNHKWNFFLQKKKEKIELFLTIRKVVMLCLLTSLSSFIKKKKKKKQVYPDLFINWYDR